MHRTVRALLSAATAALCATTVLIGVSAGPARAAPPVPAQLSSTLDGLAGRSTARWDLMAGPMLESLYLDVDDRDGALELTYTVDLRILSRAGAERVLRGTEDIAVAMALDPDAPSGVPGLAAEPAVAR